MCKLSDAVETLACEISGLTCELRATSDTQMILDRIETMEIKIMSKISEYAAKQTEFNDRLDTAVTDVQGDIKTLNETIEALQNSPGEVTPEDQASLDSLQARAQAIAEKIEALAAQTPPAVPAA